MKIIADLHLHSKYSRAVSPQMILPEIGKWAKIKGIDLIATGDFTHPLWSREIKANFEEAGEGLYRVHGQESPLFILNTEVSSIYSQGGKLRRIHNLIFAPNIGEMEKINLELGKRGKLASDGRPILGMSAHDVAALVLTTSPEAMIVPAHIWTPWFSLFGSESGFDSIEECFGDMAKYIYAIETGLSSDPAMNWKIGELDTRSIISNSDAHSGPKLGREATVFEIEDIGKLKYQDIKEALMSGGQAIGESGDQNVSASENQAVSASERIEPKISHTIEFYPEEGKYHYTGHRNCHVKQTPEETREKGTICPVCGKGLTVGVMHRVEKLATREIKTEDLILKNDEYGVKWIGYKERPPYAMLVPLAEIIAESLGTASFSQKAIIEYKKLTDNLGGEFKVLLESKPEEIEKLVGSKITEGIQKVRTGNIVVDPGYDGEFGIVKIWGNDQEASLASIKEEPQETKEQLELF
jgi:PHP family Zn ribbon phosphoesterase